MLETQQRHWHRIVWWFFQARRSSSFGWLAKRQSNLSWRHFKRQQMKKLQLFILYAEHQQSLRLLFVVFSCLVEIELLNRVQLGLLRALHNNTWHSIAACGKGVQTVLGYCQTRYNFGKHFWIINSLFQFLNKQENF